MNDHKNETKVAINHDKRQTMPDEKENRQKDTPPTEKPATPRSE